MTTQEKYLQRLIWTLEERRDDLSSAILAIEDAHGSIILANDLRSKYDLVMTELEGLYAKAFPIMPETECVSASMH